MDIFWEILKICIPLLISLLVVYLLIHKFLKNEDNRRKFLLRQKDSKDILMMKLQAYERLILYLERIAPEALVGRLKTPESTAEVLKFAMVKTIQKEFEHNLSQQIYVSEEAWSFVVKAKDSLIALVHKSAHKAVAEKTDMLGAMQDLLDEMEAQPHRIALNFVGAEARQILH